ncbi:pyridoxamine 5'-phosphate oxidase family protein [Thermodesulfobacteriota bacterium]
MIEQMKQLVKDEKFCVLATVMDNKPYCSLMAYVPEKDCCKIYMATHRNTIKYRNLTQNGEVSLLIDTREQRYDNKVHEIKALTIAGRFAEVKDRSLQMEAQDMLFQRHPYLGVFLEHPDSCLFAVEVYSFLLLDGLTDSFYEVVSSL